jgi:hypothetical protein
MMRRETRGGELNLIRVLRHDLTEEHLPMVVFHPGRVIVIVVSSIAAVMAAIQIFN